jgi:type IV pilus assembly protein PilC
MPFYIYSTLTPVGESATRAGYFDTLDTLDSVLGRRGEMLYRSIEVPRFAVNIVRRFFGRVQPLDVAELCAGLGLYASGGVDIVSSLRDLAQMAKNRALRRGLLDMRAMVEDGRPVSEAMQTTGLFPDLVVGMARIGESTGNLGQLMQDAGKHIERVEAIKSTVKRALIYPGITLVTMVGAIVFWLGYVVPKVALLFYDLRIPLPLLTRVLIAMGEFVSKYWVVVLLGLFAIPVAFLLARRWSRFRLWSDEMFWRAPLVGKLIQGYQYAFYFQYLALMYGAGIVITTALETVKRALQNSFFRKKVETVEEHLRAGETISVSLSKTQIFEPLAVRMVGVGEEIGKMEEQLRKLAEIYYGRVQALADMLGKLIEPLIIGVLGGLFAFFIIALLGPLYDLISQVGLRGAN